MSTDAPSRYSATRTGGCYCLGWATDGAPVLPISRRGRAAALRAHREGEHRGNANSAGIDRNPYADATVGRTPYEGCQLPKYDGGARNVGRCGSGNTGPLAFIVRDRRAGRCRDRPEQSSRGSGREVRGGAADTRGARERRAAVSAIGDSRDDVAVDDPVILHPLVRGALSC